MDPCGKHESQTESSELGQVSVKRLRRLFEASADARLQKQETSQSHRLKQIRLFDKAELTGGKTMDLQTPVRSPPSAVSMKSDRSMDPITVFKEQLHSKGSDPSPVRSPPSAVSMKSDRSMDPITVFKDTNQPELQGPQQQTALPSSSCVSMRSDRSMDPITVFQDGRQSVHNGDELQDATVHHQTDLDSIFKALEENIAGFVKSELKKFLNIVGPDYHEYLKNQRDGEEEQDGGEEEQDGGEEEQENPSGESFLRLSLHFLRRMKQKRLADYLQSKTSSTRYQQRHKWSLRRRFQRVFEGIAKGGSPSLLNQIYTELHMTEAGTGEVNAEHEVRQIEMTPRKQGSPEPVRVEDIFKLHSDKAQPIRTMLTKGVAGIGKTILTQKFTLDWAEDKSNQDIHFTFPFTFRELNVLKEKSFSLVQLVHRFFPQSKEICNFEQFNVLFIFDGLDEYRSSLDFHSSPILSDVTESSSLDVLLVNLIRGKLLPAARLWMTMRPSAASLIPPQCVDVMTEVRGFSDSQKEEYFRKRFKDKKQANRIVSYIKSSRSLHIMCHIPIFCWINATVLEDLLSSSEQGELPNTLTEMYIHFLVVQTKVKKVKYDEGTETDPHWSPESRTMIESLGKLAFDQLQKGNLIFYESDLAGSGIDIRAASVYSGVFTQIFREERGLYQDKVFCFIHLSVQEFLAALHVHLTFMNSGVNLLLAAQNTPETGERAPAVIHLHQLAVDAALQSPNGHWDMFLRFLLGLSQPVNQALLRGLQAQSSSQSNRDTIQYIKQKISDDVSVEKSINLFHCLNELNDRSLVEEIQQFLKSGRLSTDSLSPAQWSALVFILLSSDEDLDVFDLKKYCASEDALLRLLPVVRASSRALLSGCNLSGRSCEALSSVLSCQSSSLRQLDLSNNKLQDEGVKLLSVGLESPNCKLVSLSLTGCLITEDGCASLAQALSCNPSHLEELDLSYNHPGDSGLMLLSSRLTDPHCKLETLRVDHCGKQWLTPGLKKYFCELELDPNTAGRKLLLSDNNKSAKIVSREQPYPDHPDRFQWNQLLCRNGLTGRCYWEVQWSGRVLVSVSYRRITRRGLSSDCWFGGNEVSWGLRCCDDVGYAICHKNNMAIVPLPQSCLSHRIAVYLDCPAGTLSYYRVSADTLTHLHTFNATFTEPLFPGFGFWFDSSASLCSL